MSVAGGLGGWLSGAFLRPLGLAALAAAVPILLVYLLKPEPDRLAFPAVEFLAGRREHSARRRLLGRLRRSAVLLAQLGAVALLAVALAAPYVPVSEQTTVEETVLVVDASASMATRTGDGGTRFDRALSAAREAIADRTSVVVAGGGTRLVAGQVPPAEARATLDGLRVTGAPGDLGAAVSRASAVAGPDARVVVLSDFAGEGWRTAVEAARAREHDVVLRQFAGGGGDNVGVVDAAFDGANVTVRVRNTGDGPATREISLGEASRSVSLQPGDVATVSLPVPAGGGELRLSPGDSLPADDAVPVVAPSDPTADVLVLTNDPSRPMLTALSVLREAEVTVKHPPASVSRAYDVVVFGDVEPGRLLDGTRSAVRRSLRRGGGVVVRAGPNLSAVEYGVGLPVEVTGTGTDPSLSDPADHPLVEGLTFPAPARYLTADLRAGRALLRTDNGTPILATARAGNGTVLYYGYPANGSAFQRHYRYPVFWKRVVAHLSGRRSLAAANRRTGATLDFGGERTVETPAGRRTASALTLRRVGVYEAGGRQYAAALLDPAESNVSAPSVGGDAGGGEASTETRQVPREVTPLVALLAVAVLLGELGLLAYRGDL